MDGEHNESTLLRAGRASHVPLRPLAGGVWGWYAREDSNLWPLAPEASALSAELRAQTYVQEHYILSSPRTLLWWQAKTILCARHLSPRSHSGPRQARNWCQSVTTRTPCSATTRTPPGQQGPSGRRLVAGFGPGSASTRDYHAAISAGGETASWFLFRQRRSLWLPSRLPPT
jgi:hypothetical protein